MALSEDDAQHTIEEYAALLSEYEEIPDGDYGAMSSMSQEIEDKWQELAEEGIVVSEQDDELFIEGWTKTFSLIEWEWRD